ncbi:MAG: hypothetical protein ABJB49_05620 [Nitrospirota bacterium]
MSSSKREPRTSIERQLFSNQVWETVAFVAKAGFMLGLTPWMLQFWGTRGYGEFALASSTFVLLSVLDLGIRGRTRVVLCHAQGFPPEHTQGILSQSIASFSFVGLAAILVAALATASHRFDRVLGISAANHYLLLVTAGMTMLVLLSGLLLEPLVVRGEIGRVKLAMAAGWLLAIPTVAFALWIEATVTAAVFGWLAALCLSNVLTAWTIPSTLRAVRPHWKMAHPRAVLASIRGGFWFNVTNSAWLARTYGATIVISALNGPAIAGTFFILLRLSEIISALGAISCDVSLAELAQASSTEQKQRSFASSYLWIVVLCAHGALVIGFLTPDFLQVWLHPVTPISAVAGLAVAALGLGSALNRTATYAALGLEAGKTAARCGLLEALLFFFVLLIVPEHFGLVPRLLAASVSCCALLPLGRAVSHHLQASSVQTWIQPLVSVIPFAGASAGLLIAASVSAELWTKVVATIACGGIVFLNVVWLRDRGASRQKQEAIATDVVATGVKVC